MSNEHEKKAYSSMKEGLLNGHHVIRRLDRVENVVLVGMPDVNGCFDGIEFWIEVKCPKEPKKRTTPLFGSNHKLSQDQKNWIKRQLLSGGLAYVYIDTGAHRILIGGSKADDLNEMTIDELKCIALWHAVCPIKEKNFWEGIADVIASRKV